MKMWLLMIFALSWALRLAAAQETAPQKTEASQKPAASSKSSTESAAHDKKTPVKTPPAAQPMLVLSSGKKVKFLGLRPIRFQDGTLTIMLRYQTNAKLADVPAMRKEADEIWSIFVHDVERMKANGAILHASNGAVGAAESGHDFIFEKIYNGSWRCLCDNPEPKTKALQVR